VVGIRTSGVLADFGAVYQELHAVDAAVAVAGRRGHRDGLTCRVTCAIGGRRQADRRQLVGRRDRDVNRRRGRAPALVVDGACLLVPYATLFRSVVGIRTSGVLADFGAIDQELHAVDAAVAVA